MRSPPSDPSGDDPDDPAALTPPLTAPLTYQLGEVTAELVRELADRDVAVWLDSGCLLGLVRDGQLPSWDKDIDLAAWREDVDAIREVAVLIARRHGLRYLERHLHGQPYAILLRRSADSTWTLPIAVHLFYRDGDEAVSEQPHYLLAQHARYARHELGLPRRGWHDLIHAVGLLPRRPGYAACTILGVLRLRRPVRRLVSLLERREKAVGVVRTHPAERRLTGWLFALFDWRVPAHHFDELVPLDDGDLTIWLPSDPPGYLARRYGPGWQQPVQDWFYVLDDACLHRQRRA